MLEFFSVLFVCLSFFCSFAIVFLEFFFLYSGENFSSKSLIIKCFKNIYWVVKNVLLRHPLRNKIPDIIQEKTEKINDKKWGNMRIALNSSSFLIILGFSFFPHFIPFFNFFLYSIRCNYKFHFPYSN